MGSFKEDTYQEVVPEHVDKTQEEWDKLSYHSQYYHAKDGRKEQVRSQEKDRLEAKRKWVAEIKSNHGCRECDEDDPRCLDFHHTGDKSENVSTMVWDDASKESLRDEISKCVVLCANCHRKKHRKI